RAWVGTWRPHRPRSFISAQFTTPAPKYSIPGTTGKPRAGRRGRTSFLPSRCYPGAAPCAAGLTDALPFPLPGVGTYMLPRLVGTVRVGSARTNTHLGHPASSTPLLQTPGPAAFSKVDLDTYKNRAPRYTMGSRTRLGGDKTVKPGPADYCPGKAPAPTFGLRHSRYTTPLILPL
uniref:Outer dense fiber of sperm tails 3 n=1 Tax=Falco tinnunculus TaxID=100819 RepID=A0A8C4XIY0_FALTI